MTGVKTRIRKNDIVQVISGAEGGLKTGAQGQENARGKRGKVLTVDRTKGKAVVEGVNVRYRHQRVSQDPSRPNVGRIEKEMPVPFAKLMIVCPKCDAATRIAIREDKREVNGKSKTVRIRVCKACGTDIPENV